MPAPAATQPAVLRSNPGIKRDGTVFEGDFYVDGQWVRFQRGLPRKIGGYRSVNKYLSEISRGFNSFSQGGLQYCHSGSANLLERFTIDANLNSSGITDRTPATLTVSDDNRWMFCQEYDSSTTSNLLLAHVTPTGADLASDTGGQIFYGDQTGTAILTEIALPVGANATGGIVVLHPYLLYHGTAGIVGWSVPGTPTDLVGAGSGIARIWGQKIVKGMPLRAGSGTAPAGLFWAYDALLRCVFVGGAEVFNFDVIATDTSVISADAIVEYDGVFYWMGVDRFLMFNGVVREVPNTMNLNWVFDNLNQAQRSKVFAFKNYRYGEIWWCYPRGDATECTHAVIYNVREDSWYDTELPADGRSAGGMNFGYAAPLLVGGRESATGFKTWIQERGTDLIDGMEIWAVESHFETGDLSSLLDGNNNRLRITQIEPDFVQSGDMTVSITGRANARAPEVVSDPVTFPASPTEPYQQIVVLKEQRRELRVKFSSNVVGGDYQMGQVIAHIGPGDSTVLG